MLGERLDVCFFAPVDDRSKLRHVGFYSQDLSALESLGHNVTIATNWRETPWSADVYFVWWWTWAFIPIIKAKLRRRPVIITGTFNLKWGDGDYYHRPFWQRMLIRLALRLADMNIFVSRHELDPIMQLGWTKNAMYGPHCVDTALYSPGSTARSGNRLLTIGWLRKENAERKGMDRIIQAMPQILERHPETHLTIVGEHDSGVDALRHMAAELGVGHAISWPGKVTEPEKISYLRDCAIYVQPSRFEGFGLAILEAMSCGAPVICSDVGAVREVVDDAGVYVVPRQLAREVGALLDNGVERARLGVAGRSRALGQFELSRREADIKTALQVVRRRKRAV